MREIAVRSAIVSVSVGEGDSVKIANVGVDARGKSYRRIYYYPTSISDEDIERDVVANKVLVEDTCVNCGYSYLRGVGDQKLHSCPVCSDIDSFSSRKLVFVDEELGLWE